MPFSNGKEGRHWWDLTERDSVQKEEFVRFPLRQPRWSISEWGTATLGFPLAHARCPDQPTAGRSNTCLTYQWSPTSRALAVNNAHCYATRSAAIYTATQRHWSEFHCDESRLLKRSNSFASVVIDLPHTALYRSVLTNWLIDWLNYP